MFKQCPHLSFLRCNISLGDCSDGCKIEKEIIKKQREQILDKQIVIDKQRKGLHGHE